jgi:hypothetical protein
VRLVEVIQIENEIAFRRGIKSEIPEVGVSADDRLDTGARHPIEVLRHQRGRPAQKGIRRYDHATDPHRNQALQAPHVRFLDAIDRIRPFRFHLPAAKLSAPELFSQRSACRSTLFSTRQPGP